MKERDYMIYKLTHMDAEGDRDEREGHHGGGNTRLPYGLCKALGIDTTGFSPRDCWKALKGEGVSPTETYAMLQKTGSTKAIVKEAKAKGAASSSPAKTLASKVETSAKPSAASAKANGKSGVGKSRTTAINALKKLGDDTRVITQNVYKGSDGRQFYTNGYMAIRLNDGNELSSEPKDCGEHADWQDVIYKLIDKAKDENHKEIDLGFTADDLKKYIKSVNEKEKGKKPSSHRYVIRIKGYSDKADGLCDSKWIAGVDAKLLLNTMEQFDNPKFFVGTDVKNTDNYMTSYDHRYNGIYIKGDNGEGVVLPVRVQTELKDDEQRWETPYIGTINSPEATTSGGSVKLSGLKKR